MKINKTVFLILLSLVACSKKASETTQGSVPLNVAQVKVSAAGAINLNGKNVSLSDLKQELQRLKGTGGAVWYYRESLQMDPTSSAFEVFQTIVGAGLPLKLSEKADFSDVQGPAS